MHRIVFPLSGELLVSQLAAYGLLVALDAAGIDAFLSHDSVSQSFEPIVEFVADLDGAARAVRASALEAEQAVEADIELGKTGNDRRPVIWARASFAKDASRPARVLRMRAQILAAAENAHARETEGLLSGLGAPAAWGEPEEPKPAQGATALDGVLGNNTSDLVRGVLRPARALAANLDEQALDRLWHRGSVDGQLDKTGWAPPGTAVDFLHQWLAALGLALLPVVHRPFGPSATPACWTGASPRRHGITLPLLARPTTIARLRAVLALGALASLADHGPSAPREPVTVDQLRSLGLEEVVSFERLYKRGSGASVAFTYRRGARVSLSYE